MSDDQDRAEAVDEDVVDVDGRDDELPADYPPDRPMGVDDPGALDVRDDVRTRAAREEPEWPARRRPDDTAELGAEDAAMHEIDP